MHEEKMGGAIEHWLGFQDKIGRTFMMNEDALKYPLSDYLVNGGGVDIGSIELERPHPYFSNRLIDIAVSKNASEASATDHQLINAFELKLAKSSTRHLIERKRIFNDLLRMKMANQCADSKCYFIMAGKTIHFQRDFQNYEDNGLVFFQNWFSFAKGQRKSFAVKNEANSIYKDIYQSFISGYSSRFTGTGSLDLPQKITTKCEFITAFKPQFVAYMAGIWSVT